MKVPFAAGYQIRQRFGENPERYAQFGLKAHEGVDLHPLDNDWTIYCVEDGVVTEDVDVPAGRAYGNSLVVFNPREGRRWTYAHFAENYVSLEQVVRRGEPLGKMGATGNVWGTDPYHLHLGVKFTDAGGNVLNRDNGYKGCVDPLPVLAQIENLESAVLARAKEATWMPVNNTAALWRFAKANGLQDQQTDELAFTYEGEQYIVQVFNLGIVYCKVGEWDKVSVVRK